MADSNLAATAPTTNTTPTSLFGGGPAPAAPAFTTTASATKSKTDNKPTWIASPDGQGDVLFTFHNHRDSHLYAKSTLLVKNAVLAAASPVFRAMFSSRFAEGQDLAQHSTANPKTIPLPYDSPGAMVEICKALHKSPASADSGSVDWLERTAVVIDKYDLVAPMRGTCEAELKKIVREAREVSYLIPDGEKLLGLAYALDTPRAFFHICRDMILSGTSVDFSDMLDTQVPARVLFEMGNIRRAAMEKLHKLTVDAVLAWVADVNGIISKDCDRQQDCGIGLACCLSRNTASIWYPQDWDGSVTEAYEYWINITRPASIKRFRRWMRDVDVCTTCRSEPWLVKELGKLREALEKAFENISAPCLDCIKNRGSHDECPRGSSREDDYWL